ncbi:hypothetical protein [Ruixingdingia sedimenti]|uniref:Uncharacterized protein n=1 Tax=Ruixingdingia sedimenti TaxID=3073604 RepID=A0ABU1FC43_9RHOB|nr:hypothetical protein [Xinfangfangia sp. LG-4]MDR5654480.1 hypothetical protein [Xinfangfangia sp. LG-4]
MSPEIQALIDQADASIAQMESARLRYTIARFNHVVLSASDFALDFTFENNGDGTRTAIAAHMTALWKAPQFTKQDAETLAAAAADGAGRPAKAVFINDAVDLMVTNTRQHIERLRALAA